MYFVLTHIITKVFHLGWLLSAVSWGTEDSAASCAAVEITAEQWCWPWHDVPVNLIKCTWDRHSIPLWKYPRKWAYLWWNVPQCQQGQKDVVPFVGMKMVSTTQRDRRGFWTRHLFCNHQATTNNKLWRRACANKCIKAYMKHNVSPSITQGLHYDYHPPTIPLHPVLLSKSP